MFEDKIFWREDFDDGAAAGGFFFRSFDLNKFLKEVEKSENGGEVVGIRFEGNNLEVIVKKQAYENVQERR